MTVQVVLSLCRRSSAIEAGPAILGSFVGDGGDLVEAAFATTINLLDRLEHCGDAGRWALDFLGTQPCDDTATAARMPEVASAG
jgi:hypothetical protein